MPSIRVNMLDRSDWEAVAKRAKKGHLAPGAASKATQERMQGLLEAFNFMVDSSMMAGAEDRAAAAKAPTPAQQKPVKLSLYHRSRTGAMQAWSDLDLQIDCEQEPTPVSLQVGISLCAQCVWLAALKAHATCSAAVMVVFTVAVRRATRALWCMASAGRCASST